MKVSWWNEEEGASVRPRLRRIFLFLGGLIIFDRIDHWSHPLWWWCRVDVHEFTIFEFDLRLCCFRVDEWKLIQYESEISLMFAKNFRQLTKWHVSDCSVSGQSNQDADNCTRMHATHTHWRTHKHTPLGRTWFQQKVVTSGYVPLSPCWTPHPDRKLVLPPHTFRQPENNSDKKNEMKKGWIELITLTTNGEM